MKSKVLIIEDQSQYAYILEKYFERAEFEVRLAFDGNNGLKEFREWNPDVIILDIMLPGMNGYDVAKKVRQTSNVPIVMMSALSDDQDILKGYTLQIDDYVTKPFKTEILIAKVTNLLERRKSLQMENTEESITVGPITINSKSYELFVNGKIQSCTPREFKLLEYLMQNAGKNCTREQLLLVVWGDEKNVDARVIDTYIKRLRSLLGPDKATITTIFGIGYRFEKEPESKEN